MPDDKNVGRPPLPAEQRRYRRDVYLTSAELDSLHEAADRDGLTVGKLIRRIVAEWILEQGPVR